MRRTKQHRSEHCQVGTIAEPQRQRRPELELGTYATAIKDENTGDYSTVYVNTASHGTNMSVSTSIPLFTGLEIPNQYALAKLNLKAALADLEKAKKISPSI